MTAVQKRRLGIQLVAFLGGLGLLGVLIRNVGVAEVASHLRQIGWLAPLLPLPYIADSVYLAWAIIFTLALGLGASGLVGAGAAAGAGRGVCHSVDPLATTEADGDGGARVRAPAATVERTGGLGSARSTDRRASA